MSKYLPGSFLLSFILLLIIPAVFYNLGLVAISADEPTRANVAMEMMYSGDYLVSTISGEYYYKKPPLFNWLLVLMYTITGSKSELVTRLAAVIPLLLFSLRIFLITRRQLSMPVALLAALMFLTFGRMLYYDSMLGHIDILYAWVTFESFYFLYTHSASQNRFLLFTGFYAFHAVGFMLKGLPSLVFPVFTILAMGIHTRKFRWMFSWQHLAGAVTAFIPVIVFFYAYSTRNSLWGWVDQLWDQSKQRTVLDKSMWESVRHVFLFPVDHLAHLAPWSLLLIFLFRNNFIITARKNPFISFLSWTLLLNLPPYWASPGYYPRYLFMLYPIIFIILGYAFWESHEKNYADRRVVRIVVKIMMTIVSLAFFGVIIYLGKPLDDFHFLVVAALLIVCLVWVFSMPKKGIWVFIAFLLVTRIAFNFYILPERQATGKTDRYKQYASELARLTQGKTLFIAPYTPIGHDYIYYLERERNSQLTVKAPVKGEELYIYNPYRPEHIRFDTISMFPVDFENMILGLGRYKPESALRH